ncbi:MAG: WD40/YVTN/BNR-like repeat-containing protein [bacterium]
MIDPDNEKILYIGTRGGFYKSVDGGRNWQAKWEGLGRPHPYRLTACIGAIAIGPDRTIYAGFGYRPTAEGGKTVNKLIKWGGSIYKSRDKGETWEKLTSLGGGVKIRSIAISPANRNLVYVASNKGLFVSSDGGKRWGKSFKGSTRAITVHPVNTNILYVSCGKDGIYKSVDGAENWIKIGNGLKFYGGRFPDNYSVIVIDPQLPDTVYVVNSTWGMGGGVYKSINGGKKWEKITRSRKRDPGNMDDSWLEGSGKINGFAIDSKNTKRMFLGSSRFIYRTEDGGKNWRQVVSSRNPAGGGGWTHRGLNVFGATRVVAVDPLDPDRLYIGTADHGLVKSVDGGKNWLTAVKGMKYKDSIYDIAVSQSTSGLLYAINLKLQEVATVSKSVDWGESWESVNSGLPEDTLFYSLLMSSDNVLYVAGGKGVYKTTDGGNRWLPLNKGLSEAGAVRKLVQHPSQPHTILAAAEQGLFKTDDAGQKWFKTHTSASPENLFSVAYDPPKAVYVGCRSKKGSPGGVFKSENGGNTWRHSLKVRGINAVAVLPDNPAIVYAVSNDDNYHDESSGEGVFRSADGGITWQSVNNGLDVLRGTCITVDKNAPGKIYLSSNGSGAYVGVDPSYTQDHNK